MIGDAIAAVVREQNARLEALFWEALASEIPVGIAVIECEPVVVADDAMLTYSMTWEEKMALHPMVPRCQIYRFTSQQAYDDWVGRGYLPA